MNKYGMASKWISILGAVVFGIGLILNNNIYLIVWGILMVITGSYYLWKAKTSGG